MANAAPLLAPSLAPTNKDAMVTNWTFGIPAIKTLDNEIPITTAVNTSMSPFERLFGSSSNKAAEVSRIKSRTKPATGLRTGPCVPIAVNMATREATLL